MRGLTDIGGRATKLVGRPRAGSDAGRGRDPYGLWSWHCKVPEFLGRSRRVRRAFCESRVFKAPSLDFLVGLLI